MMRFRNSTIVFLLLTGVIGFWLNGMSLAAEPKYGGTLRKAISEPRTFDPHKDTGANTPRVINSTYNTLLRWNADLTKIEPDLAESWERVDDRTYIFNIPKGVHFHDIPPVNGREVTSEDIKYSIERLTGLHGEKPKFKNRYYFEDKLESITTPDRYTVVFKTKEPYAPFVHYIASPWCAIVPREAVEKFGDLSRHVIGTGPFMLEEYVKGSHISLVRNPNYFKKGLPYLDKIHMRVMANPMVIMSAFIAGELDIMSAQFFQIRSIKRKDPDVEIIRGRLLYNFHLRTPAWSDDRPLKPPFDNPNIRQAIAMAIDKNRFLKLAWGGYGTVQVGPVPYWPPYSLPATDQVEYNPEKAKKLLAEAGYANGFSAEMITPNNPAMTTGAQVAQAMLKEVGINVDLKILEFAQFFTRAWKFDYEMAYTSLTAGFDPEEYLIPYFGDTRKATYYQWNNKEVHKMIEEQRKIMDPQKRALMIQEIQRKILKDSPMVFVYALDIAGAFKPYVHPKRWFINPYDGESEDIWLDK